MDHHRPPAFSAGEAFAMRLGVAMVTALYPPSVGGIQTQTKELSEKLAERGVSVTVVTRRFGSAPEFEEVNGVRVFRVGTTFGSRAIKTGAYVSQAVRLLSRLKDSYDVLHCQQLLSPLTVGLLAKSLTSRALVVNPHACGPIGDVAQLRKPGGVQKMLGSWRLNGALKNADAFVAISRPIERELREIGVDDARLWRVANGVDVSTFRPTTLEERASLRRKLEIRPGARIAVYCGRLAKEKGVDLLLGAWAKAKEKLSHAELLVLGDGDEREALERMAKKLGLESSVHFFGSVQDPSPYVRAADLAVLPSRTEGLPVALLEALACGLPVVATAVGGTPEVMDESMGLLVEPESVDALARGLLTLFADPEAKKKGERGRDRVVSRYSLDAVADRFVQLYSALLSSSRGSLPDPLSVTPA